MGPGGPYGMPMNSVQTNMGTMHGPPNRGASMLPSGSSSGMRMQMMPGGRASMAPSSMQGMQQAGGPIRSMHMANMGNQRMGLSMSSGSVGTQQQRMGVQGIQNGVQNMNMGMTGRHMPGMAGMPVGEQHMRMAAAQMMPGPSSHFGGNGGSGSNGNGGGGSGGVGGVGSSGVAVGSGGNFGPGGMHGQQGQQQMEGVNFDMASDFPALGNQSELQREMAAKRQADYKLQSKEDFPALGGAPGGPGGPPGAREQQKDDNGGYNFPPQANYANGGPQQSSGIGMRNAQFDHFMSKGHTSAQPSSTAPATGTPASREHAFGLLGLLGVIRMTDADLNTLALGTDLTALGLNLNSPNCLYNSFLSPFADSPSHRDPEFALPRCYSIQAPMQPPVVKIHCFSEETLFYIFYSMPKDQIQLVAAIELYNRDWRYHKRLQRWFTRVSATEPVVKTNSYETGSYIYFEPSSWEKLKKEGFTLVYDDLEERARVAPQHQQHPHQQQQAQKPLRSSVA